MMNNKTPKGYYHCPECDMLFDSEVKPRAGLFCPQCGNQPSALRSKIAAHSFSDQLAHAPSESDILLNKQRKRTKNKRAGMWVIITLVVGLLVTGVVFNMKKAAAEKEEKQLASENKVEKQKAHTNQELNEIAANFNEMIGAFIKESNHRELAKFIYDPTRLESEMWKYYRQNPLLVIGSPRVRITAASYIREEKPYMFGGVFEVEGGEEHEFSMIQYGSIYKMDWPFYVRYNEYSLDDFLKNSEVIEADFRLYMRVLDLEDSVSLVFYPPKTDPEGGFDGVISSSVELTKDDTRVTEIMSILNREERVDREFRDFIKGRDPDGYERVRVRLRLKIDEKKGNSLELIKLIANDWYYVDVTNMN